jgi:hypothetical protein
MQSLTLAVSNRSSRRWASLRILLPGLLLTFTIAPAAFELRNFSHALSHFFACRRRAPRPTSTQCPAGRSLRS